MQNSAHENDFGGLLDNQLTTRELFQYVKAAYGKQVNGNEFTYSTVNTWLRNKAVPVAYGGHKITDIEKREEFNMSILTVTNFDRSILSGVKDMPKPPPPLPKVSRARKQRTKLYYEILEKAGKQTTVKTLKDATLPDDYLELGIRKNQLTGVHKKKRKQLTVNTKA